MKSIELFFLETRDNIIYNQKQEEFVGNLSIIDILMFNDVQTIKKFLKEYELKK